MKVILRESNDRGFASNLTLADPFMNNKSPKAVTCNWALTVQARMVLIKHLHLKHSQHPYFQRSPMNGTDSSSVVSNDSHSFVLVQMMIKPIARKTG